MSRTMTRFKPTPQTAATAMAAHYSRPDTAHSSGVVVECTDHEVRFTLGGNGYTETTLLTFEEESTTVVIENSDGLKFTAQIPGMLKPAALEPLRAALFAAMHGLPSGKVDINGTGIF